MILVTGGAGYIGIHTSLQLLHEGYELVIVDNFTNSSLESINRLKKITKKQFKLYHVDLLDKSALEMIFRENKISAVVHLAGLKSVGESVRFPLEYYSNNIIGTLNLCEIMKKFGIKSLVFSSSATVYGENNKMPVTENAHLSTTNPYGRSKLIIESILGDLYKSDKEWSIAILRYFNPVGAHSSGQFGEAPNGTPNNLMPFVSQVAIGIREELKVFGDNYTTRDGTGVRDYIHIEDLAKGHIKALSNILESSGLEAYNLGTGKGYSVLEVIKTFEEVSGKIIPYTIVDRRDGDIAECYADPSKAYDKLGWKAEKGLFEMCVDAWRWQKNNPNGYKNSNSKEEIIFT